MFPTCCIMRKVCFLSHSCTILRWILKNLISKTLYTHAMLFSCFSKRATLRFLYMNILARIILSYRFWR
nr:MAG TPA: hypothetical protein [Caudoviricetes sp.]